MSHSSEDIALFHPVNPFLASRNIASAIARLGMTGRYSGLFIRVPDILAILMLSMYLAVTSLD